MTGLVPDPTFGVVVVADATGHTVDSVPQPGLFTTIGTSFTVTGGLAYLRPPGVLGTCGGRVTSMQMNFVESELLALAQAFDASFTWNPAKGNNIALAFAAMEAGVDTVNVTDIFGQPLGRLLKQGG